MLHDSFESTEGRLEDHCDVIRHGDFVDSESREHRLMPSSQSLMLSHLGVHELDLLLLHGQLLLVPCLDNPCSEYALLVMLLGINWSGVADCVEELTHHVEVPLPLKVRYHGCNLLRLDGDLEPLSQRFRALVTLEDSRGILEAFLHFAVLL